jgi:hypothetical protein
MDPIRLRPHHLENGVGKYLEWLNGLNGGQEMRDFERRHEENVYGRTFADLHYNLITSIINDPNIPIIIEESWDMLCASGICALRPNCNYEHECKRDIKRIRDLGLCIGQLTTSGYVTSKIRELWKIDERKEHILTEYQINCPKLTLYKI